MDEKFSYNEAISELEKILRDLQSDKCDIDSMVAMTKRAAILIGQCKERLTATETELKAVLDTLHPD